MIIFKLVYFDPYHDYMRAAFFRWAKRTAVGEPIPMSIIYNPVGNGMLLLNRNSLIRVANTL
jgi:hypothetical protein